MRLRTVLGLKMMRGLGWAFLLVALFTTLPLIDAVTCLRVLLASLAASWLILAGLAPYEGRSWTGSLEQILLRWLMITAAIGGTYWFGATSGPGLLHLLLGSGHALFLSLCGLAQTYRGRLAKLSELHVPLLAGLVLLGGGVAQVSADFVLLGSMFLLAGLSTRALSGSFLAISRRSRLQAEGTVLASGVTLSRYVDLLLLPWFLPLGAALPYLLARLMSAFIGFGLNGLDHLATPALLRSKRAEERRGLAARINLGTLLIGGAMAVAVLGAGRLIPLLGWPAMSDFTKTLPWLVGAAAGPAIFGATQLLLPYFGGKQVLASSAWGVAGLFGLGLFYQPIQNSEDYAIVFAAAVMTHHTVCAIGLGIKSGIWPGITALLFRQIRVK